jgi:Gpi18-like mannosyltransferase
MNLKDRIYLAHTTTFTTEALAIKLPFIAFDFITAYLLARIIREFSSETPSMPGIAALLYLFNPLVICISSFWGLYESIGLTFTLCGLYFMLKERYITSSFLFGLASATKLYGFMGLAILLVYLIQQKKFRLIPLSITAHLGILFFTYLPLASWNPAAVIEYIFTTSGLLGRLGLASSTNFIPSASYMTLTQMLGVPIPPPTLYIILAFMIFYLLCYFGRSSTPRQMPSFAAVKFLIILLLITYLFFFRVYEQYYVWIVPLVILLSILSKEKSYAILMMCLTTYVSLFMVNTLTIISGEEHYIIFTQLPKDAAAVNSGASALVALMALLMFKPHSTMMKDTHSLLATTILTALSTTFTAYSLLNEFSLKYMIPALIFWTFLLLHILNSRRRNEQRGLHVG